ncbi:hypothetical protein GGI05_004320, partial [Coemansia sp. RSA 2603]
MRVFSAVATLVSVVSVAVHAAPLALDGGLIGDPLEIFIQSAGNTLTAALVGSSASSSGKTSSSSSRTSSSSSSTSSSSTSHSSTSQSSSSSSSSSSSAAPSPSSSPDNGSSNSSGGIPDGQGNNFNTPSGAVKFPWNYGNSDNVVPITPSSSNGGWAMSPNQQCMPNSWCPYACASGYYSAQWDPSATLYNGAGSMNGGLFADASGKLKKPFPERPFCVPGMMNAAIRNTLGQSVSACQTVYPGNEAMIIPTVAQAGGTAQLNIVPSSYWLGTSSQFYVNKAGSTAEQCIWGTSAEPVGNWGPYIFGGGQGKDGNTYISVQYNPLYGQAGFSKDG